MFSNDADLVIKNIWLGNKSSSQNRDFLNNNKIKLVVNCTTDIHIPQWYEEDGINYIRLPIYDWNSESNNNILKAEIMNIINTMNIYKESNKNILVHCFAGMQRSATVIACYLMYYYNFKPEHAIFYIRNKRNIAFQPYPTFNSFIFNYKKNIEYKNN
jgi:dual specificity MAP kinase phosphatase